MATLEEMQKLGYGATSSAPDQIVNLLHGYTDQQQKQNQQKIKDMNDQAQLYINLREAGYSEADATARVNRNYRSTNFLENMMQGKSNDVFNPGTGEDKVGTEQAKSQAATALDTAKAETEKAKADWYRQGGARGRGYEGLSPNQIQTRIKDLRGQIGMGTEEDDANINSEVAYLNDLFNKKSGYQQTGQSPDTGNTAQAMVIMTGPDGRKWRVPKSRVSDARQRGWK